jgi:hypothetical protein
MSNRIENRNNGRLRLGTLVIALGTVAVALSMLIASPVNVNAMLTPEAAAQSAVKHEPVVMPEEWVWRGRAPLNLEYMYGNRQPAQPDYIVMHRAQ